MILTVSGIKNIDILQLELPLTTVDSSEFMGWDCLRQDSSPPDLQAMNDESFTRCRSLKQITV